MGKGAAKQWPADKVERRKVADLMPYARNARTHSPEQVSEIAASIREWGWTMPVLVDEAGQIIAGHGRVMAAQELGIDDIPTMTARGWTEAQRRAYVIADNKLAMNAGWDDAVLGGEFEALKLADFDLSLTGFSGDELADVMADRTPGQVEPDEVPPLPELPVSARGDTWRLGDHRLRCGDATSGDDVAALLAGAAPHLMVTDPPYGVEYDPAWRDESAKRWPSMGNRKDTAKGKVANDDLADWRDAWALFPGDVAYVWSAGLRSVESVISLQSAGFVVRAQIIWAKAHLAIGRGHYHFQHEPCWYAVRKGKTGHWTGDRKQTTLWQIEHRKSDTGHSTQKPVECMRRPLVNNSKPGDAVYDPFCGSGTTLIAGAMEGRTVFAMEISPAYVDLAVERWQNFTGRTATLEATGETFDQRRAKGSE